MPPCGVCTHACVCTLMPCGDVTQLTQIRWVSASLNARRGRARARRCGSDNPMMPQRAGADRRETSAQRKEHVGQRREQQIGPTYSRWLQLVQHLNRGKALRWELLYIFKRRNFSQFTDCLPSSIFDSTSITKLLKDTEYLS